MMSTIRAGDVVKIKGWKADRLVTATGPGKRTIFTCDYQEVSVDICTVVRAASDADHLSTLVYYAGEQGTRGAAAVSNLSDWRRSHPNGHRIRAGDEVRDVTTNLKWTIAAVDDETKRLTTCDWPEKVLELKDCELVDMCSDDAHVAILREAIAGGSAMTATWARRNLDDWEKAHPAAKAPAAAATTEPGAKGMGVVNLSDLPPLPRHLCGFFYFNHEARRWHFVHDPSLDNESGTVNLSFVPKVFSVGIPELKS